MWWFIKQQNCTFPQASVLIRCLSARCENHACIANFPLCQVVPDVSHICLVWALIFTIGVARFSQEIKFPKPACWPPERRTMCSLAEEPGSLCGVAVASWHRQSGEISANDEFKCKWQLDSRKQITAITWLNRSKLKTRPRTWTDWSCVI